MKTTFDAIKGTLGLAARAGKCVCGDRAVEQAVCGGKAFCLILDETAGPNAVKKYRNLGESGRIPVWSFDGIDVGLITGKPGKIVCAITDPAFMQMIEAHACPVDSGRK